MNLRRPGTGEVVEPTKAQKKEDKVLGSFPSRSSTWKVLMISYRVFWPIYIIFILMFAFTVVFSISITMDGLDPELSLVPVVIVFFVILLVPLLLSFQFLEVKKDRVEVTKGEVRVFHHFMMNAYTIYNSIEISNIKSVRVAGKGYAKERKQRTNLSDRLLTNPKPPPGGLYFMFHEPKGLVIIKMVRPVPIVNLSTLIEKKMRWWPSLKRTYVKEIIVEIDREYHDRFISMIERIVK